MLHHIEIYVSDLMRTRQFYDELFRRLGYAFGDEWDTGFSYIIDGYYIVFVQADVDYINYGYHRKRIGLNHLAFSVSSTIEVDAIREWLQQLSMPLLYDERYPYAGGGNHYAVFFEDPDRIKLEVVAQDD